jgi:DNA invertase Pin-like site-specific DNA recombinase
VDTLHADLPREGWQIVSKSGEFELFRKACRKNFSARFAGCEKVVSLHLQKALCDMAKIGYIFNTPYADGLEKDREWMWQFGCCDIVEEPEEQEVLRPEWKHLLQRLEQGDELVVTKLSNAVRGSRELALFLEVCRRRTIRVVSIHDRIDSRNQEFPETRISDVLNIFAQLPTEVSEMRDASAREVKRQRPLSNIEAHHVGKLERNRSIVNMYKSNYSMDEISAVCGFRSRSSLYRILHEAGIPMRHPSKASRV